MLEVVEMEGYAFIGTGYSANVVEMARKLQPDLILLDYCLPDSNGKELCILLHDADGLKKSPIVLLSAFPDCWIPLEHLPHVAFIPKPFELQVLLTCIAEVLLQAQRIERQKIFMN